MLILGAGPSVAAHRDGSQNLVRKRKLFVIALSTQTCIDAELIDVRALYHLFRLLADCQSNRSLPQPLVIPEARLLGEVRESFFGDNKA